MEKNEHQCKGFGNGFFWGLIIGGGIVALLITKRGREILHELVDHILSSLEEMVEPKDLVPQDTYEEDVEGFVSQDGEEAPEDVGVKTNGSSKKRIFKGIKRK